MRVQAVLYSCFVFTVNCSFTKGDHHCTERTSHSTLILACTGYTQIPKPSQTSFDHALVDVLELNSKNHIQTIKTGEFIHAGFINVKAIFMIKCNIKTIESGAFRDLKSLIAVHLQNNTIESLNMEMFANNDHLLTLDLSGNLIHTFIGTQFPKLPLLALIDFDDGRITEIPSKAFEHLENLQVLGLSNNKIRRLDWHTFQYSKKMTQIYLADNEWDCDCHMRFLDSFLYEMKIDIAPIIVCKRPDKFANISLRNISHRELTCPPQITGLTLSASDLTSDAHDVMIYSETGQDIGLDCVVDGYPKPEIVWIKDDKPVEDYNKLNTENGQGSHYKVIDTDTDGQIRADFKHTFTKHLAIYNASKDDIGTYGCVTYHKADSASLIGRSVFLNLTNTSILTVSRTTMENKDEIPSTPWMWVIIFASALALTLLLIAIFISKWRNYLNTRMDRRFQKRINRIMKEPSGLVTYAGPQPSEDGPYSQILIS